MNSLSLPLLAQKKNMVAPDSSPDSQSDLQSLAVDIVQPSPQWTQIQIQTAHRATHIAFAQAQQNGYIQKGHIIARSSPLATITLVFADNDFIQNLNQRFRGINRPTNVLAFPSAPASPMAFPSPPDSPALLGEIVMAYEVIQQESHEKTIPLHHHAAHMTAHGTLHLLGFTHDHDHTAAQMENLEKNILTILNIKNPYENRQQDKASSHERKKPKRKT